jgi:hypothetical protein
MDSEDSFEQAFGLRYDPLETRVRKDIIREGGGVRLGPLASASPLAAPASAVTTTTPSAQELIANRLRLVLTHGPDTDLTYEQIIALRARLTAPVETNALDLARALRAWRVTDWEGSDAAIDRILTRSPGHARALKIRAKTAYGRVSERQSEQSLWDAAETAAIQGLIARPEDAELHLFRVAVSLPVTQNISPGAQISLDWLQARNTHLRLPHAAMMMIPALIYENRFDHADRVLDSAARWKETAGDKWVIERLRGNVAAERAERE